MTSQSKNDRERTMPRPSTEIQCIRDERHEHLLRAAAHMFARKGLTATTISDIAAAANVSHGLAYHYFTSKEEIFRHTKEVYYGHPIEKECSFSLPAVVTYLRTFVAPTTLF